MEIYNVTLLKKEHLNPISLIFLNMYHLVFEFKKKRLHSESSRIFALNAMGLRAVI